MIRFDATKLAAVAVAQSTEATRYHLCGVLFDGNLAVATDGHKMTVARDENSANDAPGIYPISKKARSAMKKAEVVTIADNVLQVVDHRGAVLHMEPCTTIDGTFPDWRRVVPAGDMQPTAAAFCRLVLGALCETAAVFGKGCAISINGSDAVSAHIVRYADQPDVFSVAMPMRTNGEMDAPKWLNGEQENAETGEAAA